ncbi:hypothetical protein [Alteromonas sp. H39]|uniref:hypothetical protein n=1 Tax=Alteromonas sp. H39 TaxID=3389876 RepID=UPI0039E0CFEF
MKDIVWEIALTGSMVFISSLLLHYLAYRKGLLSVWQDDDDDQVQSEEVTDEQRENESNPLIQKWLAFGGGYYGIIAFVRLLIIEFKQLQDLVNNWKGFEAFAGGVDLNSIIGLIVSVFSAQFQTFAAAISWPAHYISTFTVSQCAAFIIATYLLYKGAQNLAWVRSRRVAVQQ